MPDHVSRARKVNEIKFPVYRPVSVRRSRICVEPAIEYFVLEKWSDYTMRHPTSGRQVSMEAYVKNPRMWRWWLRTGEVRNPEEWRYA